MQLTIDREFQALIPPLQDTEYAQLEENIKALGCQDSLKVWNGIIVDGHNRYKICTGNGIPFEVREMHFEDRDAVIIWIIKNQFGRRNLLPFQRSELALKMKPLVQKKAKANLVVSTGGTVPRPLQKSEKVVPIHTDEELAKLAGVSRSTIRQAEKIIEKGTPEQQERARAGGQGNTVNAIYNEVVHRGVTERRCDVCGETLPIERFKGNRKVCKSCTDQRKTTKNTDIRFVQDVVADVRNYTPKAYTAENLEEDLKALNADFTKKVKTALSIHDDLLMTAEGKKKVTAALIEAGAMIARLKEVVDRA